MSQPRYRSGQASNPGPHISSCKNRRSLWLGLTLLLITTQLSATEIAVLEFELNDLTLNPDLLEETRRTASLRPLLVEQLGAHHDIGVVENPASARVEAEKGHGRLRPESIKRIRFAVWNGYTPGCMEGL